MITLQDHINTFAFQASSISSYRCSCILQNKFKKSVSLSTLVGMRITTKDFKMHC